MAGSRSQSLTGNFAMQDRATPSRWQRLSLWLASPSALLLLTAGLTYGYFPPTAGWNENSRFNLTRAIVDGGTIYIDAYHLNTGDKSLCGKQHYCTDKAPGTSLFGIVPYSLYRLYLDARGAPEPKAQVIFSNPKRARQKHVTSNDRVRVNASFLTALYVVNLFGATIPGAIAVVLLVHLCLMMGFRPGAAMLCGAIYGFGTIAFPFSTSLFGHQLAACAFFAAFVLVERVRRGVAPNRQRWMLLAAGFLAAFSLMTEYPMAIPVAGLGLYFLLTCPRRAQVGWLILGGLPPVLGLCAYLWAAFGSPFSVGYGHLADPEFAAGQGQGLYGLTFPRLAALFGTLFGRFRGLLYISPVLALSLLGWIRLWRRDEGQRPLLVFCAAMFGYFLLLNASYYMWWGGASVGPRHVVPMLPFLALPLVDLLDSSWRWRAPVLVLGAISMANVLVLTCVGVKAPEHGDLLLEYAWPAVLGLSDRAMHLTLGRMVGLSQHVSVGVLLLLWAVSGLLIAQRVAEQNDPQAP